MDSAPHLKKAKTTGVSDWFAFDWQYIVDLLRIPFVKEASAVIVAMPTLVNVGLLERLVGSEVPRSVWATWIAALLYIAFFLAGYLSCPRFIREYRDFGEYQKRSHSNRFIGWELSKVFSKHQAEGLVEELEEKGLVKPAGITRDQLIRSNLPRKEFNGLAMFGPNNVGLSLHTYYIIGDKVVELELGDGTVASCDEVQRNLFWIVYANLAKSRPFWRLFTWLLFWLAVAAYFVSLSWNVLRAL